MRVVFIIGYDEADALENSDIFYSRRDARIRTSGGSKKVFEIEVYFNEESLKEV